MQVGTLSVQEEGVWFPDFVEHLNAWPQFRDVPIWYERQPRVAPVLTKVAIHRKHLQRHKDIIINHQSSIINHHQSSSIIINHHHQSSSSIIIINHHHQSSSSIIIINHHHQSSSSIIII